MNPDSAQGNARIGRGMLWLAAISLLGGLTMFFSVFDGDSPRMSQGRDAQGRAQVVLEQGRGGHYLADGAINGQAVRFLVDTGATDVAVSERMARQLGLDFGPRVTVQTAAGPARAWVTWLSSVSVGGLTLNNVRATITPALGDEALLGMSFLKHYSLRQEGGSLTIASTGSTGA